MNSTRKTTRTERIKMYYVEYSSKFRLIFTKFNGLAHLEYLLFAIPNLWAAIYLATHMDDWSSVETLLLLLWGVLVYFFEKTSRRYIGQVSEEHYQIACDAKGRSSMEAIRRKLLFQALALKNYVLEDLLQDAKYLEDHLIQPFQKTYRPFVNGFKVFTPILLFVPQFLFVSESYETKCLLLKVSLGGLLLLVSLVVMIMPYIHMYYSDVRQRDLLIAQWLTEWVDEQQRAA